MKIPIDLIPLTYQVSKQVFDGEITGEAGADIIVGDKRMNRNSAKDYINNFKYLKTGKKFSRTLNADSMDYYFEHFLLDYGIDNLSNPLLALQRHINYYENKQQTTMHKMREILERYTTLTDLPILVTTEIQILENIKTFEYYLASGTDMEKKEAVQLLSSGIDLIAYSFKEETRFATSKFVGYVNNRFFKYTKKQTDGRQSTPAINEILRIQPQTDEQLEKQHIKYCQNLGFSPSVTGGTGGNRRKFWALKLDADFEENKELTDGFPEGKIVERSHKTRERNSLVIAIAKENFKKKHGTLHCEVCKVNFEEKYGDIGKDYIEGHHTIAVSQMLPGYKTKPEEIAMLCSNCHSMVHKKRPWLSLDQLSTLLNK